MDAKRTSYLDREEKTNWTNRDAPAGAISREGFHSRIMGERAPPSNSELKWILSTPDALLSRDYEGRLAGVRLSYNMYGILRLGLPSLTDPNSPKT